MGAEAPLRMRRGDVVHKAAFTGIWRVLKRAREHDCPWDAVMCACHRI